MVRKIQALVFDAYGTLFDPDSLGSVCEAAFPGYGRRLSELWRAKQVQYTWLRSLMGKYLDFWRLTESALVFACRTLGLRCDPATRNRLMKAYLAIEPYPDVPEALATLASYTLAILSNGTPRMLRAAVQEAGLERVLTSIVSVDQAKIYKPSPRVYKLAVERLGLDRRAIGFVSSNCWDVIGGKAFGFWTCWVNRSGQCVDELGFRPDVTVRKLTELKEKLPRS